MACFTTVDYSQIQGERRLPFVFELDEENSILTPGAGENQRFCYTVMGIGEDLPTDVDLSHFVLGICPALTQEDILSARVIIDGVEQTVVLGENVAVRTAANPDPTTGCTGLKFDFGLDKVDGEMSFCFTLARTFAIGSTRLCVNGGTVVQNSLFICGPSCEAAAGCQTTISQRASVCVPVTVTPYAVTGVISAICCDAPIVTAGRAPCLENPNRSCTFTISQELCLNIPVAFGAAAEVGTTHTECAGISTDGCDCGGLGG